MSRRDASILVAIVGQLDLNRLVLRDRLAEGRGAAART